MLKLYSITVRYQTPGGARSSFEGATWAATYEDAKVKVLAQLDRDPRRKVCTVLGFTGEVLADMTL
jgi:hypothetical protein